MWDNYLSAIRPEFWDCRNENSLVFMEGTTPFHFDPRYYKEAHQVFLFFFISIPLAARRRTSFFVFYFFLPALLQKAHKLTKVQLNPRA
jgi:hypothetical protein